MSLNSEAIPPRINLKWERSPHMYLLGKIPQGPPPTLERCGLVTSEVHQDSDFGLVTSSSTLDSLLPEPHP